MTDNYGVREPWYRAFFRRWWALFGGVSLIIGLVLAAAQSRVEWLLLPALAITTAIALAWVLVPKLARMYVVLKDKHPAALKRIAVLEDEVSKLRRRVDDEGAARGGAYDEGFLEGATQVMGSLVATSQAAQPVPSITGVGASSGDVYLYAEATSKVNAPARYWLEITNNGERKGVVQVVSRPSERPIRLRCVHRTNSEYWERLAERAVTDPSPPVGARLAPYDGIPRLLQLIEGLEDLAKEVDIGDNGTD